MSAKSNYGWYALVASGSVVLVLLVGSVVEPMMVQELTPKYEVVFSQSPTTECGGPLYGMPWAVRLGNETLRKGGGDLPTERGRSLEFVAPNLLNLTKIEFAVSNGSYNYTLIPAGDFWDPISNPQGVVNGTVVVDGHDVRVNVTAANPGTCG
jgi:hypothetical protein